MPQRGIEEGTGHKLFGVEGLRKLDLRIILREICKNKNIYDLSMKKQWKVIFNRQITMQTQTDVKDVPIQGSVYGSQVRAGTKPGGLICPAQW